ncbi:hypothetical protein P7F60_07820 [Rhizobium sp. YJ-22]|uniref:hypothetical protein n=1 Tax=Rhizobium sp. YJ-22 TaxID=3037556 RepID=UPI00241268D9|nr:hypothetical protein [Rhizobium sp. YJ-22]MDG3576290.1 hypothetical protein [Rhizobium sp. YJ-22]
MSNVEPDEQEEKPLDPAMENVRRKMVRLQLVSAGIMGVLLMAVLVTIGYKLTRSSAPAAAPVTAGGLAIPSDEPLKAMANLPAGFVIDNTSLSGAQILFTGRLADGKRKALVFDIAVGRIVADIDIAGN